MLAVNLGTRGLAEALDLLEYANGEAGTALADLRVANGSPEPHDVRVWCLGNEMDGPWQIGSRTAEEYGRLAARVASAMRRADSTLELVACGSSSAQMPTFGTWERVVLEHAYDDVDFVSLHAYYQQHGDRPRVLPGQRGGHGPVRRDGGGDVDEVRVAQAGPTTRCHLSFDEWNVWDQVSFNADEQAQNAAAATTPREWTVAPHLIEDTYRAADAVVVGSLLISLLRHADRVHAACLAQLVNVIAPIRTEPGRAGLAAGHVPPVRPDRPARARRGAADGRAMRRPSRRPVRPGPCRRRRRDLGRLGRRRDGAGGQPQRDRRGRGAGRPRAGWTCRG